MQHLDSADYAIVVGINHYPNFTPLQGPINDAMQFVAWLQKPEGGNIPNGQHATMQIDRIKEFYSAENPAGKPIRDEVYDYCGTLVTTAQQHVANGDRLAKRLYLFFAGHGICSEDLNEGCLLMANASSVMLGLSVPGNMLAQYFVKTNLFSEVVLLMDCCRSRKITAPPSGIPMSLVGAAGGDVAEFTALAAPWGSVAREKPFPPPDDRCHGVFTKAVLDGLNGHAAEGGQVTGSSLSKYVTKAVSGFLGADYQKPRVLVGPARDIVFATLSVPTLVTIEFDNINDNEVELQRGDFTPIEKKKRSAGPWSVKLSMGLYRLVDKATGEKMTLDPSGTAMRVKFDQKLVEADQ